MQRSIRRRRHEAKTDYRARLALLQSAKARLVIRKTNRYIIVQLVSTSIAQDSLIAGVTSKDLLGQGWPTEKRGSLKSLPAAYLSGYLLGKRASGKVDSAILDIGMHRNIHKSRIYAALKGAVDAGLHIEHSKEILPSDDQLESNKDLRALFTKVKSHIHHG